jgi:hypothetical protein
MLLIEGVLERVLFFYMLKRLKMLKYNIVLEYFCEKIVSRYIWII